MGVLEATTFQPQLVNRAACVPVAQTHRMPPLLVLWVELQSLGVECGENVRIHHSCVLIGTENLRIGNHVRVDCFALLSAGPDGITIGNHVHIAAGAYLFGGGGPIVMEDQPRHLKPSGIVVCESVSKGVFVAHYQNIEFFVLHFLYYHFLE